MVSEAEVIEGMITGTESDDASKPVDSGRFICSQWRHNLFNIRTMNFSKCKLFCDWEFRAVGLGWLHWSVALFICNRLIFSFVISPIVCLPC